MPPHETLTFRDDCRHYLGDRPCRHNRLCAGCPHYEPTGPRICIIKIGAIGDVIRTLCILPHLKHAYPGCQITWVTGPAAMAFLAGHPRIDQLLPFDANHALALQHQRFDLLLSLDKEPAPTALGLAINAREKKGIGLSPAGKPIPLNDEARPYFALGLSDELKFNHNRDSYPKLIYEAMGWTYRGQQYHLAIPDAARAAARARLLERGWLADRPTVGINVGAAETFANKMWPPARVIDLLKRLHVAQPDTQAVLLGGAREAERLDFVADRVPWAINTGGDNDAQTFVGLIDHCDVLFCGDTLAMHLAIARQRGVVAFFGPTCEQEIDLFGLGEKLIAGTPCSPCYKRKCDQADACLDAIDTGAALAAIRRVLSARLADRRTADPLERAG